MFVAAETCQIRGEILLLGCWFAVRVPTNKLTLSILWLGEVDENEISLNQRTPLSDNKRSYKWAGNAGGFLGVRILNSAALKTKPSNSSI